MALRKFAGDMYPHIAFGTGASVVMDHRDSRLVTLVVGNDEQFLTQTVIYRAEHIESKAQYPTGHRLSGKGKAHLDQVCFLTVQWEPQAELIVNDGSCQRTGNQAVFEKYVFHRNADELVLQSNRKDGGVGNFPV